MRNADEDCNFDQSTFCDNHDMRRFWAALVLVGFFALTITAKQKEFVAPPVDNASSYPAHDSHPSEHVTVAAEPYDTKKKLETFTIPFKKADFLPIFVVVTNNGDQPIAMTNLKMELVTRRKTKIFPAANDDIWRRVGNWKPKGATGPRFPIPFPRTGVETPNPAHEVQDELDRASFKAKAVDAHESQGGFFFFDIKGVSEPIAGASLFVSGLRDANGGELFFFEIPLDKYLNAQHH
jgi:hypothetical protein